MSETCRFCPPFVSSHMIVSRADTAITPHGVLAHRGNCTLCLLAAYTSGCWTCAGNICR